MQCKTKEEGKDLSANNGHFDMSSSMSQTLPNHAALASGFPPSFSSCGYVGMPSLVQEQRLVQIRMDHRPHDSREECTEMVDLLVACVEAISAGSIAIINHLLARLGRLASPEGSAMHRLAAYFTEGLACRVSRTWPHIYQPLLQPGVVVDHEQQELDGGIMAMAMRGRSWEKGSDDRVSAWQLLNEATPLVKFSQFTANEMILQAFEGEERVHVIDFDIKQGLQWPALFYGLAKRKEGPPKQVRVTGRGECKEEVQDAGDRLAEFAEEVGLSLEFHGVVDKLEDVRLWMLHVKGEPDREAVAVNCILQLHQALGDGSGSALRNLLSLIRSTRPKVIAMVEQEADCHDHPSLSATFSHAFRYFAAVFDALDAALPASSAARFQLEAHFAAHIRNILACDGQQRFERYQPLRRWQRLFAPAGFHSVPLSHRCRLQAQLLLRMFSSNYRLLIPDSDDHHHHLTLAWLDHPLLTASAWKPVTSAS